MARLVIARRELGSLSREKTIVLALLVQLFVAAFSSFLVVGLTSLYDPAATTGGTVEVAVAGNASDALEEAADEVEGIQTDQFADVDRAGTAFRRGDIDALLIATYRPPHRVVAVESRVPRGSLRTTLIVTRIRAMLEALERAERHRRSSHLDRPVLGLPPQVPASPYFGFTYSVLLPLLLFLPVFISGSIVVDAITEEVERGTLELLRVTPHDLGVIVDGKAIAAIALAPVQAALWLTLLAFNGIAVHAPSALLVLVSAFTVIVVAVAVGITVLVPSRQRAQLLYSSAIIVGFGGSSLLPEHPGATVARLAVDSLGPYTHAHLAGYVVAAVLLAGLVRWVVVRADPERL